MNRTVRLVLAWVAGTLASIAVAYAAVGSVRDNVSDDPVSVVAAAAPLASSVSTTSPPPASTAPPIEPVQGTSDQFSTTETTIAPTPKAEPSTTTTTAITVPTTRAPDVGEITTFIGQGGSMSVEVVGDHLVLLGAVPSAGYTIKDEGIKSRRITIKFETSDHSTKLVAELKDGELKWKVDEKDKGG